MTLKKFVTSFIFFYLSFSFPLNSQKFRTIDIEFGVQQHTFFQKKHIKEDFLTYPISFQAVYWKDFGGSFDLSSDDALRNNKYQIIANKAYNSPMVGVYVNYLTNLNSNFGTGFTLGAITDIGIWQKGSSFISVRPKIGVSNFTKNQNALLTINHRLLGSQLNANLGLGVFFTTQRPIQSIKLGLELNHFSNGAIKSPNLSINLLGVSASYLFGNYLFPWLPDERKEIQQAFKNTDHRIYFKSQLGIFTKQLDPNGVYYGGFTSTLGAYKPLNVWLDLNTKLTLSNDNSRKSEADQNNITLKNNYRTGVSAGLVLHFHRLNLHANTGIYLYKPERTLDQLFYQQYQLDYKLTHKFYTFTSLLAHKGTTDYLDFGIGIKL